MGIRLEGKELRAGPLPPDLGFSSLLSMAKGMRVISDLASHKAACTETRGCVEGLSMGGPVSRHFSGGCSDSLHVPGSPESTGTSSPIWAMRVTCVGNPRSAVGSNAPSSACGSFPALPAAPEPGTMGRRTPPVLTSVWPGRKAASLEKPLLGPDAELSLGPACHPATWTAQPRARTLWVERAGISWALRHIPRQMESCAPGRKGGMCQQDQPSFPEFWDFISIRAQEGARAQLPKLLGADLAQTRGGICLLLLCQCFGFLLGHSLADLLPSIGASNPTPEPCSSIPLIQHQHGHYSVHHTHVDGVDPILDQLR